MYKIGNFVLLSWVGEQVINWSPFIKVFESKKQTVLNSRHFFKSKLPLSTSEVKSQLLIQSAMQLSNTMRDENPVL